MSSFSCPHYDQRRDDCDRVRDLCVPGRPGCVLCGNSRFAVSWQERLAAKRKLREDNDLSSDKNAPASR